MNVSLRPNREHLLSAVKEAVGQITTGLLLTILVYLVITVASTSDEMLLRGSELQLPFLDLELSLVRFYLYTPLLVLGMHLWLLLQTAALRRKILAYRRLSQAWWPQWSLLLPTVGLGSARGGDLLSWLLSINSLGWFVLPLFLLLQMEWTFLPYRSPISAWHAGLVTVDLALLAFLLWWLPRWDEEPVGRRRYWRTLVFRSDREAAVGVAVVVLAIFAWVMPGVETWKRLDVSGRLLVGSEPGPEMFAALTTLPGEGAGERPQDEELRLRQLEVLRFHSKGLDLTGRDLRGADFTGAKLYNVVLRGADLSEAVLVNADLSGADLNPRGFESWPGSRYKSGDDRRRHLAELDRPVYERTRLVGANLEGAVLERVEMVGAVLTEARLDGARLDGAQMMGADLQRASLAGRVRLVGVDLYAARLDNASLVEADLRGTILAEAALTGADLRSALVVGSDLTRADVRLARMNLADLRATSLEGAVVLAADFGGADLRRATGLLPQGAILRGAKVADANLCGQTPPDPSGEEAPRRLAVPLLTLGDLRALDATPAEAVTIPEVLTTALSEEDRERLEKRLSTVLPCRPGRVQSPGSLLLSTGEASPGSVDAFYAELAGRLVNAVCPPTPDLSLAAAVERRVRQAARDPRPDPLSARLRRRAGADGSIRCSPSVAVPQGGETGDG